MCEEKTREGAADTGSASVVVGQDRSRTGGGYTAADGGDGDI